MCYRAVTIHRPRATLAARRALPPSRKKKPISSRLFLSGITELNVASRNAVSIHWPSSAKHGTAFTTARAPDNETRYLNTQEVKANSSIPLTKPIQPGRVCNYTV